MGDGVFAASVSGKVISFPVATNNIGQIELQVRELNYKGFQKTRRVAARSGILGCSRRWDLRRCLLYARRIAGRRVDGLPDAEEPTEDPTNGFLGLRNAYRTVTGLRLWRSGWTRAGSDNPNTADEDYDGQQEQNAFLHLLTFHEG